MNEGVAEWVTVVARCTRGPIDHCERIDLQRIIPGPGMNIQPPQLIGAFDENLF